MLAGANHAWWRKDDQNTPHQVLSIQHAANILCCVFRLLVHWKRSVGRTMFGRHCRTWGQAHGLERAVIQDVFANPVPLGPDVPFMLQELMTCLHNVLGIWRPGRCWWRRKVCCKQLSKPGFGNVAREWPVSWPWKQCAWVWTVVNWARQQAMTPIYHLELQLRMSFPATHPLFSGRFCACMLVVEPLCIERRRHPFWGTVWTWVRRWDRQFCRFVDTELRQKGMTKWTKILFSMKTTSNKKYVPLTRAMTCKLMGYLNPRCIRNLAFTVGRLKEHWAADWNQVLPRNQPHMVNFENVPRERIPNVDDQVSADCMFINAPFKFGYRRHQYAPISLNSFWFWALSSLSQPATPLNFKLQSSYREGGDEGASERARMRICLSISRWWWHISVSRCSRHLGYRWHVWNMILSLALTDAKVQIMISLFAFIP